MNARAPLWPYLFGAAIGVVLGAANLVVGLTLGIGVSVAVTAVTLVSATRALLRRSGWTTTDAVVVQSVASAAGYSTCSALASATTAAILLGDAPGIPVLVAWVLVSAVAGTLLASALRQQLVVDERLPFPTGVAAAETLELTFEAGGRAVKRTQQLVLSALLAALVTLVRDFWAWVPSTFNFRSPRAERWAVGLDLSPLALGLGSLVGPRIAFSLALMPLLAVVLGPTLSAWLGVAADFNSVAPSLLWPGVGLMLGSGLYHLASGLKQMRWVRDLPRRGLGLPAAALALLAGIAVFGLKLDPLAAAIAIALIVPIAAISGRVTGETDITPAGVLGNAVQLAVGFRRISPGASAWASSITATCAAASGDTLTDFATGHRLKVDPKIQLRAQLVGCCVGALVLVPVFALLATPEALRSHYGAPAAKMVIGVSLATTAPGGLSRGVLGALLGSLLVGLVMTWLEERVLKRFSFRLSPSAIGLSLLLPPSLCITLFAGAAIAWLLRKHEEPVMAVASGALVGEGIMAVAIAVAHALGA